MSNVLVDKVGLEPTMPEAEDLQSPGVTNFPTHPIFWSGVQESNSHSRCRRPLYYPLY